MARGFRALMVMALAAGGLAATAPAAHASATCGAALPMAPTAQMGSATVQGTVGVFEQSDWWRHTANPAPRTVTVVSDGEVDLFVHTACAAPAVCTSANNGPDTCRITQSGDIFIEVRLHLPSLFANYSLSVTVPPPAPCADGVDNDNDGATDFPADSNCSSFNDPTEAPFRQMVSGGITWGIDTAQTPLTVTYVAWGVVGNRYTCTVPQSFPIRMVCDANPDPEIQWVCSTFPLQADAPSVFQANSNRTGDVSGWMTCDSGAVLRTADVVGRGSARTTNHQQGVNLGDGNRITCGSAGINGGANGVGSFSITCGPVDPGLVWPYGDSPIGVTPGDVVTGTITLPDTMRL